MTTRFLEYQRGVRRPSISRRQLFWILGAVLATPLALFVLWDTGIGAEQRSYLWPWIDTRQAPGYSERSFEKIKVGMTRAEVDVLMCPPMFIDTAQNGLAIRLADGASRDVGFVRYSYTCDGRCPWGDFAWMQREVYFTDGVVTRVLRGMYYD